MRGRPLTGEVSLWKTCSWVCSRALATFFFTRPISAAFLPASSSTSSEVIREYQPSRTPFLGAASHRLPIGRDGLDRDLPRLRRPESAPARGDDEARGEPLQIPLERGAQGLVEVVDVEDESSLGRRVAAEIEQVAVAAGLDVDPARRRSIEVVGLDGGRAPKERERRLEHPPMADRDQILEPARVRSLEQRDDVAPRAMSENDLAMRRARALLPQGPAPPHPFLATANLQSCHDVPV